MTSSSQELFFNGTRVSNFDVPIASYSIDNATFQIGNSVRGDIGHVLVFNQTATVEDLGSAGVQLARRFGTTWDGSVLVPEPGSATLLLAGGLLLRLCRRRWR